MIFDNRFNSKKVDPLVEAAKAAMELGQKRRDAIAAVNEEFGVFNRNAVVRENLAAYDARIEEAYKSLKEGKPLSPKQQKMASLAGDPKKIDAADLASLRKGAKIDEKKMWEAKIKVKGNDPLEARAEYARKGGTGQVYKKTHSKDKVGMSQADAYAIRNTGPKRGSHLPEETIEEAVSRKHFQQVADLIKSHDSQEKRNELASHHASIFSKQNPRFDHGRFHKAAGSTAHEAPSNVKESVLAAVRAKYMKEQQGFNSAQVSGKSVEEQVSLAGAPLPPRRPASLSAPKSVPMPPRRPTSLGGTPAPSSKPGVVSKSDLDTYRKNVGNANATLGQYMNDLKGKTAVKGGANDPSVIQKKLAPQGLKAFDPTKPEKMQGPNPPKEQGPPMPRQQGPEMPDTPAPKSDPLDSTNTPVSGSRHDGGAGLDAPTPTPPKQGSGDSYKDREPGWRDTPPQPVPPKPMAGEPPPPAPKADDQEAKNKSSSMVAESVMVGGNRYRIV